MIDWNDWTPLTRYEFDAFIGAAIPYLISMEDKNGWDFFVNDRGVEYFCHKFLIKAFEMNDYDHYQKNNRKVKDMNTICSLILEADWTDENETLRKYKDSDIWKLVLNKVNTIADSVF